MIDSKWILSSLGILMMLAVAIQPGVAMVQDVSIDHYAYDSVVMMVDRGYLRVFADGSFDGETEVSRFELAEALAKILDDIQSGQLTAGAEEVRILRELTTEFRQELVEFYADQDALNHRLDSLEQVTATSDERLSRITTAQARLEEQVVQELVEAERLLSSHAHILERYGQDISAVQSTLDDLGDLVSNQIFLLEDFQNETETRSHTVDQWIASLEDWKEQSSAWMETADTIMDEATQNIVQLSREIRRAIQDAATIAGSLDELMADIDALALEELIVQVDGLETLGEQLIQRADGFDKELAQLQQVEDQIEAMDADISGRINEMMMQILDLQDAQAGILDELGGVAETDELRQEQLVLQRSEIERRVADLRDELRSEMVQIRQDIMDLDDSLNNKLQLEVTGLLQKMESGLLESDAALQDLDNRFVDLTREMHVLQDKMIIELNALDQALAEEAASREEEFSQISERIGQLQESMAIRATHVDSQINQVKQEAQTAREAAEDELTAVRLDVLARIEQVEQELDDLAQLSQDDIEAVRLELLDRVDQVDQGLVDLAQLSQDDIAKATDQLQYELSELRETVERRISDQLSRLQMEIEGLDSETGAQLAQQLEAISEVEGQTLERVRQLEIKLVNEVNQILQLLEEDGIKLQEELAEKIQELRVQLQQDLDATGTEMAALESLVREELATMVSQNRAGEQHLQQQFDSLASDVRNLSDSLGAEISATEDKLMHLTDALAQENQQILETITSELADSSHMLQESIAALDTDLRARLTSVVSDMYLHLDAHEELLDAHDEDLLQQQARISRLEQSIDTLSSQLTQELAEQDHVVLDRLTELRTDIATEIATVQEAAEHLQVEIDGEITSLRSELQRQETESSGYRQLQDEAMEILRQRLDALDQDLEEQRNATAIMAADTNEQFLSFEEQFGTDLTALEEDVREELEQLRLARSDDEEIFQQQLSSLQLELDQLRSEVEGESQQSAEELNAIHEQLASLAVRMDQYSEELRESIENLDYLTRRIEGEIAVQMNTALIREQRLERQLRELQDDFAAFKAQAEEEQSSLRTTTTIAIGAAILGIILGVTGN